MTDLTFLTNEAGNKLLHRFTSLIKDTNRFDCLVGYFYTSGFHQLYKSLENTKKIRILIGMSTDKKTYDLIQESKEKHQERNFAHGEAKEKFSEKIVNEMDNSKDSSDVEGGIRKFIEWIQSKKLEIRIFPSDKFTPNYTS